MKIIFINDFLMHSSSNKPTYHRWFINLIESIIKNVVGVGITDLYDLKSESENFSCEKFFQLSNIKDYTECYYNYNIDSIKEESWDYLFQYITPDTFIIGFEIGLALRKVLDKKNIRFINFWVHSYKLFDDVPFMVNTNDRKIYETLLKYQIPKVKFDFYTTYWKNFIIENNKLNDSFISDNCVLFIGQTFKDASIKKDDKYLNILDYKDKLAELSKKYSKIYYVPHPSVANIKEVDRYIKQTSYIEKLQNIPTYYLLASNKVKKVIGISSSVLYEAQKFGKEIEYLYQPLFDIDGDFGLNTFVSILNDYFNPKFWADVFAPYFDVTSCKLDEVLFQDVRNKVRNIRGLYWGYKDLEPVHPTVQTILNKQEAMIKSVMMARGKIIINFKLLLYKLLSEITRGATKDKFVTKYEKYKDYKLSINSIMKGL